MGINISVRQQTELGSKQWGIYGDGVLLEGGFFAQGSAVAAAGQYLPASDVKPGDRVRVKNGVVGAGFVYVVARVGLGYVGGGRLVRVAEGHGYGGVAVDDVEVVPTTPQADTRCAVRPSTCPGCNGAGVLTDDPQVLRCESCGGIFTDGELPITWMQAIQFVKINQPMLANAGDEGQFYFDLDVTNDRPTIGAAGHRRLHGWADRATRRVVQWG